MGALSPHHAAVAKEYEDLPLDPPENRLQTGQMLPENRYSSNQAMFNEVRNGEICEDLGLGVVAGGYAVQEILVVRNPTSTSISRRQL
jgi:hypothetical protein